MKNVFLFLVASLLSTSMAFAYVDSSGEDLVSGLERGDKTAIALAQKYFFKDVADESPELKKVRPKDIDNAFKGKVLLNSERARLVDYFDSAIERSYEDLKNDDDIQDRYNDYVRYPTNPNSAYAGYSAIMMNMIYAYQAMWGLPLWMMWGGFSLGH